MSCSSSPAVLVLGLCSRRSGPKAVDTRPRRRVRDVDEGLFTSRTGYPRPVPASRRRAPMVRLDPRVVFLEAEAASAVFRGAFALATVEFHAVVLPWIMQSRFMRGESRLYTVRIFSSSSARKILFDRFGPSFGRLVAYGWGSVGDFFFASLIFSIGTFAFDSDELRFAAWFVARLVHRRIVREFTYSRE